MLRGASGKHLVLLCVHPVYFREKNIFFARAAVKSSSKSTSETFLSALRLPLLPRAPHNVQHILVVVLLPRMQMNRPNTIVATDVMRHWGGREAGRASSVHPWGFP